MSPFGSVTAAAPLRPAESGARTVHPPAPGVYDSTPATGSLRPFTRPRPPATYTLPPEAATAASARPAGRSGTAASLHVRPGLMENVLRRSPYVRLGKPRPPATTIRSPTGAASMPHA